MESSQIRRRLHTKTAMECCGAHGGVSHGRSEHGHAGFGRRTNGLHVPSWAWAIHLNHAFLRCSMRLFSHCVLARNGEPLRLLAADWLISGAAGADAVGPPLRHLHQRAVAGHWGTIKGWWGVGASTPLKGERGERRALAAWSGSRGTNLPQRQRQMHTNPQQQRRQTRRRPLPRPPRKTIICPPCDSRRQTCIQP